MGLVTRSKFYYGHSVSGDNNIIEFSEGGPNLLASITVGDYSLTDYLNEVGVALNEAGALTYTVSVDRVSRLITISATGTFELYPATGLSGNAFTLLGYTLDKSGTSSYEADTVTGSEYKPQFLLDVFVPSENSKKRIGSVRKNSASGRPEVVSFGQINFTSMNITYITDIDQGLNSDAIETDLSGVANARAFMDYITDIKTIEFMRDRNSPNLFEELLLESTRESPSGTDYDLKELFSRGLAEYFETGKLIFRKTA